MPQQDKEKIKKLRRSQELQVDVTATDNLVGFFALLLEIDKRINAEGYRREQHDHA